MAVQAVLKAQINMRSPVGARLAAQYCRALTRSSDDPETHDPTGTDTPASDVLYASDDPDVSTGDGCVSDIPPTDDDCESYASDDDPASLDGGLEQTAAAQAAAATPAATAATKHTAVWPRIEDVYAHVVQQLVNHPLARLDVNAANKLGQRPLHIAAEHGHAAIAEVLLSAGASVHATDNMDQQPLHKATPAGHIAVVQLLLKHGAVVYAKDSTGAVPLFVAAREGHGSVVQALLSEGATSEVRDFAGQQPQLAAVAAASFPAVRSMRSVHAIVLAADSQLAAEYAKAWLWNNSKQQDQLLQQMLLQQLADQSVPLAAMPDLNSEQVQLVTGLQPRGESDYLDTIQLLLRAGADVSGGVDERQSTALHQAAAGGAEQVTRMLLEAGAQIDAKDETGRVFLSNAAAEGKKGVVQLLLGWPGQDADAVDSRDGDEGNTPLMWAAGGGHVGVMQQLLNAGASPTASNEDGLTPLMHAAMAGSAASLQLLVKAGAPLENTDKQMHTALSWAAEEGHTGAVQALLAAGAHVDANVPISEDFVQEQPPCCWRENKGTLEL